MIEQLREFDAHMHAFLEGLPGGGLERYEEERWQSMYINYHQPYVMRLWRPWGNDLRIYLHKIYPCTRDKALLHPHPWPSAMKVVSGQYEMGVGYGAGNEAPKIASTLTLPAGATYEMTDPDAWHYVRPIGGPAYSLMITGRPWNRESPGSGLETRRLTDEEILSMATVFRHVYGVLK